MKWWYDTLMSKEDSRQFLLIPHSIEFLHGPQLRRMCKMPKDADWWSYGGGGVGRSMQDGVK